MAEAFAGLRGFGQTKCSIGNPASAGFLFSAATAALAALNLLQPSLVP
jgi:hypothetical protein